MFNPSALGVALLILLATTTMVDSSSSNTRTFHAAHRSLSSLIANTKVGYMMGSYQRQTNSISLSRRTLDQPHTLTISAPSGTTLQGTITIDGRTRLTLGQGSSSFDLSPYLTQSATQVVIEATYTPASAAVSIVFEGPDTTVRQGSSGTGQINYQLNLMLD